MRVTVSPQFGTSASENQPVSCEDSTVLSLPGTCQKAPYTLKIDEECISRHTLLLGGTGCGKTNLMFRIVSQLIGRMTGDDVMIIFDSKGDYYKRFGAGAGRVVIGNSPEYRGASQKWNIFNEVMADGSDREFCRLNAMEIARSMFAQRMSNTTNAFFPSAAQDVFGSLLVSICRDAESDDLLRREQMNNRDLTYYLQSSAPDALCAQLAAYADLLAATSYIEGGNEQSQGVIAEMYSIIRDLFIGVFAEKGNFSMRQFVRARGKKVLFLEYDLAIGSLLTPVYRLMIDLALKEALSQQSERGNVYFIFDEFKLLPHLQHVDDAVNFGRSKGVKVFAGLQSIEQLYDLYGQSKGRSIAAGFSTLFAFHANDDATMKYISGLYGRNLLRLETIGADGRLTQIIQPSNVIEDWVLSALQKGEAVVCLPSKPPYIMRFQKFA